MDKQTFPRIEWCGGISSAEHDVSIRLVPNEINQEQATDLGSREPLVMFKAHSTRLKRKSKYFQVCLSNRWTHPDANPPPPSSIRKELSLELIHGLQVASYIDCFPCMYTPPRKNFKDVKSSLDLLRVASQIEFHELVNSICRYLSNIHWSGQDELWIRQSASFPDFPRSQAGGLVARLQIGEHGNEDHRKKLVRGHIVHSLRIALRKEDSVRKEHFLSAQAFFEDFFSNLLRGETDSAFEVDVVTIVSKEVKGMLESFHEEYVVGTEMENVHVSHFRRKLKGLCWGLELLLKAHVAEEVIECLLHLESFLEIILVAWSVDSSQQASKNVPLEFCKLVIFMFQEVSVGRLLLEIPDRILLIEKWQFLNGALDLEFETQKDDNMILFTEEFGQAVEGVFLTLPLEQQLELLQQNRIFSQRFIRTMSLNESDERKLAR